MSTMQTHKCVFIVLIAFGCSHVEASFTSSYQHPADSVSPPDTSRRLDGSVLCDWVNSSCTIKSAAAAELFRDAPATSAIKQFWERCKPCFSPKSIDMCLAASKECAWSGELCECNADLSMVMPSMAGLTDGCGWYGEVILAQEKCSRATSCLSTPGCELKDEWEVPDKPSVATGQYWGESMLCKKVSKCRAVEIEATAGAMSLLGCADFEAEYDKCVQSAADVYNITLGVHVRGLSNFSRSWALRQLIYHHVAACIKPTCKVYGESLEAVLAGIGDFWVAHIPESCPAHWLVMDARRAYTQMKCLGGDTQSSCKAIKDCEWKTVNGCTNMFYVDTSNWRGPAPAPFYGRSWSDSVNPVRHNYECGLREDAMFDILAKGSCDADVGLLARVSKATNACASSTEEVACKAQSKPAVPTQPTCTQLKARGSTAAGATVTTTTVTTTTVTTTIVDDLKTEWIRQRGGSGFDSASTAMTTTSSSTTTTTSRTASTAMTTASSTTSTSATTLSASLTKTARPPKGTTSSSITTTTNRQVFGPISVGIVVSSLPWLA